MHVSTMVRRTTALLTVLTAAAACSDAPTAPQAAPRRADFYENATQLSANRSAGDQRYGDDGEERITIDPRVSRVYWFGQNWIYFPAHSICDPATAGYAPTLWDAACQPLTKPITITARWKHKGGHGYVDFEPSLRFVPASAHDTGRWVILSMYDRKMLKDAASYRILYHAGDDLWIDESLTDPTLCAWLDRQHSMVYRRIKHFSGYMITAAFADFDGRLSDASY